MLFQTPEFALLLLLSLLLFFGPLRRHRLLVLGTTGLLFYVWSGWRDLALFLVVFTVVYSLSKLVRPGGPRWPLVLSIGLLLGNLCLFKYGGFLWDNLAQLAQWAHLPLPGQRPSLWLPLGISFYSFEIISYLVDRFRGRVEPARSYWHLLVFILFFGHLIAGPIMRGGDFLPQLDRLGPADPIGLTMARLRKAGWYLLLGLVKKVVLADLLARTVDARFAAAGTLDHAGAWLAAYLFAFQIYFDFSGYSDMAIGLGHLFGLEISVNFRTPYLAANLSEFWRRWHITLSSWLRDYLYIPLGGNRRSSTRTYANLVITMALGGLWHGANWTFLIWGLIHGGAQAVHRLLFPGKASATKAAPTSWRTRLFRLGGIALTFHVVCLAWIFFRADTLHQGLTIAGQALDFRQASTWRLHVRDLAIVAALYLLHVLEEYALAPERPLARYWYRLPAMLRGIGYAAATLLVVVGLAKGSATFLYFRF